MKKSKLLISTLIAATALSVPVWAEVAGPTYSGTIYTWSGRTTSGNDLAFGYYYSTTLDESGNATYTGTISGESGSWTNVSSAIATDKTTNSSQNTLRFVALSSLTDETYPAGTIQAANYTFAPLALGGIIVESGATGFSITSSGSYNRSIILGNGNGVASFSTINEDFSISNSGGDTNTEFTLRGTQTWNVAEGKTFTLTSKNNINCTGTLTLDGAGTVALGSSLSVALDATLTASAGTLTLSGAATVSGTMNLNEGANLSVASTGSLTVAEGANLNLNGNVALTSAIQNSGTVSVANTAIFELGGLTATGDSSDTYTLISGGTISNWDTSTLSTKNFQVDGFTLSRGSSVGLDTAGAVVLTQGSETASLVWAPGDTSNPVWNTDPENKVWQNNSTADSFYNGDNVTFNTENATVTLGENVKTGTMTVSTNTTFAGTGTISVNASDLTLGDNVVMTINDGVTLDLGSTESLSKKIAGAGTVKFAMGTATWSDTITLSSDFSGVVNVTSGQFTITSSDIGSGSYLLGANANFQTTSIKEITNNITFTGTSEFHTNGSDVLTLSGDVKLENGASVTKKGGGTLNLNKGISGNGTFNITAGTTTLSGTSTIIGSLIVKSATNISGTANVTNIRQSGGTLTISGLATVGNYVGSHENVAGTLTIADTGVLTITGNSNSTGGSAGSFMIANYSQSNVVNVNGVLNLKNAHITVRDGTGTLNINEGAEANFNTELNVARNSNSGVSVVLNNGARMNIGSGGINTSTNYTLTLNGGTIGSLADAWTTDRALTLGGAITIDTAKKNLNDNGKATDAGTDATITLNGIVSGDGSLTVSGAGTLNLNAANTYSGGTTISAGTLVAANASALGSGAVSVASGAKLQANAAITLSADTQNLTLKVADAQKGTDAQLITANESGSITVSESAKVLIDITNLTLSGTESVALAIATENALNVSSTDLFEVGEWADDAWTVSDLWTVGSYSAGVVTLNAIPEPSAFGLLAGLGALALAGTRRRRSKAK